MGLCALAAALRVLHGAAGPSLRRQADARFLLLFSGNSVVIRISCVTSVLGPDARCCCCAPAIGCHSSLACHGFCVFHPGSSHARHAVVGNCIARRNHRFFVLMLLFGAAGLLGVCLAGASEISVLQQDVWSCAVLAPLFSPSSSFPLLACLASRTGGVEPASGFVGLRLCGSVRSQGALLEPCFPHTCMHCTLYV